MPTKRRRAITDRQQAILKFINGYIEDNGFPPSVREIGQHFGVYPGTIQDHISALERKGYLRKRRFQSRTLSVQTSSHHPILGSNPIPIVGSVAAGQPLLAHENIDRIVQLPRDWAATEDFLLKIKGNSMEGAHILDGDYVLVHPQQNVLNGEIVVALIGDEATVKRFSRTNRGIILNAENPQFDPIKVGANEADTFRIVGKVVGVFRVLKK